MTTIGRHFDFRYVRISGGSSRSLWASPVYSSCSRLAVGCKVLCSVPRYQ
jgi:hypothetical protein